MRWQDKRVIYKSQLLSYVKNEQGEFENKNTIPLKLAAKNES